MPFGGAEIYVSLTEFKKKTKSVLGRLGRSGKPGILTLRSKPSYVLAPIGPYAQEQHDYALLKDLLRAEHAVSQGKGLPARKARKRIRAILD
jgi:hypothetical protein